MPKKAGHLPLLAAHPPPQCIRGNCAWGAHVIRGGYRIWRKGGPNDLHAFVRENLSAMSIFVKQFTPILIELYSLSLAVYLHDSTKGDGLQKGGLCPPPPPPPRIRPWLFPSCQNRKRGVLRAKMCMAKIQVWATKL